MEAEDTQDGGSDGGGGGGGLLFKKMDFHEFRKEKKMWPCFMNMQNLIMWYKSDR